MDDNKIYPSDIDPVVRMANYFEAVPGRRDWPNHSVKDLELVLIVNGCFTADDPEHQRTELQAGDVLLIRTGHPCNLLFSSGQKNVISCIHFELMKRQSIAAGDYTIGPDTPWVIHARNDWQIVELFRKCASLSDSLHMYNEALQNTVFKELWIRLMALYAGQISRGMDDRINGMAAFIRENLKEPITRQDLANEFGITPEHVNYVFKRHLGICPSQLIKRERVREATRLLDSGRYSISEVAGRVGYKDPLYFSRVFREVMGVSPRKYHSI